MDSSPTSFYKKIGILVENNELIQIWLANILISGR